VKGDSFEKYWPNYIDGEFCHGGAGGIEVKDPSTGDTLAEHALADAGDVERAVRAAQRVHKAGTLAHLHPMERGQMARKIGQYLSDNIEEIKRSITLEQGKPLFEAGKEINLAIRLFEYFGSMAESLEGRSVPGDNSRFDFTVYEPFGVSAQFMPGHYPIYLLVDDGLLQLLPARRYPGDWGSHHRYAQRHSREIPSQETYSYREILLEYLKRGARWYSAPKPMLKDSLFEVDHAYPVSNDHEPVFDAANVLRFGRDLLYLTSSTGNELGARWLQSALREDFTVHTCRLNYYGSHINTSVVALRPGLLLCNPERVTKDMLPPLFRSWDIIFSPPLIDGNGFDDDYLSHSIGSNWIDMNLFSIDPNHVVVDRDQLPLIRLLEKHGLNVVPLISCLLPTALNQRALPVDNIFGF
jgi:hypothetical protein